jgi:hypothetical protein
VGCRAETLVEADLLSGEHRRLACGCRRLAGIIYGLSSFRRAACAPQKEMRVTRSDLGRPSSFKTSASFATDIPPPRSIMIKSTHLRPAVAGLLRKSSRAGGAAGEHEAHSELNVGRSLNCDWGLRFTFSGPREIHEVCIDSLTPVSSPATLADLTIYPPASQHGVF